MIYQPLMRTGDVESVRSADESWTLKEHCFMNQKGSFEGKIEEKWLAKHAAQTPI